jgi:rubrerythrin
MSDNHLLPVSAAHTTGHDIHRRRSKMLKAGDSVDEGAYICLKCGETVIIEQDGKELPPCPKCGGTEYS